MSTPEDEQDEARFEEWQERTEGGTKTNQQILEKAIEKAIDGGWHGIDLKKCWIGESGNIYPMPGELGMSISFYDVIYNHDFAKALWGEEIREAKVLYAEFADGSKQYLAPPILTWAFHLQQMVMADDPIKYLGEHI